ncbi:Esterase/lipase/thioesterase family protein isoform 1 [Tripterygium wilfordii]|uniref:Esterase/lipase/thioesterase family protein isoform 1 n=1 Tax=Tripterygium wilfordii TaxID=458696 RepID=A0A7J7CP38_TRIWF|nr:acyltransferase-like protein At3g26840, chloroplastic [Tripterygium wilfordii]KAF5735853.1 Esterase/lipase/thioesterase family protein isoform 1 [Tripterygium wilfordii]
MAATGASIFAAGLSSRFHRDITTRRFSVSTEQHTITISSVPTTSTVTTGTNISNHRGFDKSREVGQPAKIHKWSLSLLEESEDLEMKTRKSFRDYFQEASDLVRSDGGDGQPRWFSPLDCGPPGVNSPLLLYLPGLVGVGLGLIRHHHRLGKIFDVWCLHIPLKDRTSFHDLVKQVETRVRSESSRSPDRPIYLVGESFGACLALAVAARNPDIDLVLILVNPATSFNKSYLQTLIPLLELIPNQFPLDLPNVLNSITGDPLWTVMDSVVKGLPLQQLVGEKLSQDMFAISSYLSVVADVLPKETLLWKLKMLKSSSAFVTSQLHAVEAQTLILSSGRDELLPSEEEGVRLRRALPKCEIRRFNEKGHFLLWEDDVDLVTVIKGANFYRRGKVMDCASDYLPPTPLEFKNIYESNRFITGVTSPVMFSTLQNGEIVRGLAGIPSEGPVILVGYHMLLGFELFPLVSEFLLERNIILRGIAHPMLFKKLKEGPFPESQQFDTMRIMGAVPVSGMNMHKLLSSKSHVLLYPGGVREALHRKGEEYKLFWPEQSEFVRMAAKFGAKIIPFGVVGEDDIGELILDYDDQKKIPFLRDLNNQILEEVVRLRVDVNGEVANQEICLPGVVPKLPGRFYFYFGKPIETEGRKELLRDREKAQEVYLQVKSEVECCLAYLREKRESDPYRSLPSRMIYQATHGLDSEIPTFEI